MSDVTKVLFRIESGEAQAVEELLPLIYDELRNLAARRMASERLDHTLQATALVHEAYVRLVDTEKAKHWDSREHFFAAAAESMRRILVDEARKRKSLKRGGDLKRATGASRIDNYTVERDDDRILAVHQALEEYETVSVRGSQVVKLRFFAGMTNEQIAQALGISVPTVKRDWAVAKVWVYRHLQNEEEQASS